MTKVYLILLPIPFPADFLGGGGLGFSSVLCCVWEDTARQMQGP